MSGWHIKLLDSLKRPSSKSLMVDKENFSFRKLQLINVESEMFPGLTRPTDTSSSDNVPIYRIAADIPAVVVNTGSSTTLLWFHDQGETMMDVYQTFCHSWPVDIFQRPNLVCPEYKGYSLRTLEENDYQENDKSCCQMAEIAYDYATRLGPHVIVIGSGIGSGPAVHVATTSCAIQRPSCGCSQVKRHKKLAWDGLLNKVARGGSVNDDRGIKLGNSEKSRVDASACGLVLINPFLSIKQLAYERIGMWSAFVKQRFDNFKKLGSFQSKLFIVVGKLDPVVSYLHGVLLHQRAASQDKRLWVAETESHQLSDWKNLVFVPLCQMWHTARLVMENLPKS